MWQKLAEPAHQHSIHGWGHVWVIWLWTTVRQVRLYIYVAVADSLISLTIPC